MVPLLDLFRLTNVKHQLPGSFSKGMQQKVMIILALLIKPDIYVVDEPFIGLDPKAMKDILDLLNKEKENGAAIILSTHILDIAERICDRFLLLDNGEIIADGDLKGIQEEHQLGNSTLYDCYEILLDRQVSDSNDNN